MFLKNTRTAKDMGYVAIFTLKQVGNSSNNYLENAVNFLFDKSKHEIEEKVKQIMNEQVLLTLASFSVE